MRWHAPTIVIAIPVSARWRAFSGVGAQPLGVGQPHIGERHVGDVQHGVEHLAAPDGHLSGVDEEDPAIGDHRQPFGPVGVEDVSSRPVQHPAVRVAVSGDSVVDRGARLLRVEPVADERRELRQCGQKRRRIGGAAEFLEHDRELHRVLRIGQLCPARVDVGLPQRRRIHSVLGDLADQGRRALLSHRVAHGVLPQPLISIELE